MNFTTGGADDFAYISRIWPLHFEPLQLDGRSRLQKELQQQLNFRNCKTPNRTSPPTMISRTAIGRSGQVALRRQSCVKPTNRRGLAAVSTGSTSFSYESADVDGVKTASRDVAGPTTKLAVVAKAGTRYQSLPGLTVGLEGFAFKVRTIPSS
jgi:hypothetical protein